MKINCLSCGVFKFNFTLDEVGLSYVPVVSLTCPECGNSIAIQERPGGGIEIAPDLHLFNERKKKK